MKLQYQIMELDSTHLKKKDDIFNSDRDRVCFISAEFGISFSNKCDTMEEALDIINYHGDDYKEYTIIPRIFMTI